VLAELSRDGGTAGNYNASYKSGDGVGIVLQPAAQLFPLRPLTVRAMFYPVGGSASALVRPQIYAVSGGVPGPLLAEGAPQLVTDFYPNWALLDISTAGLTLIVPQQLFVVIRYENGEVGATASVTLDSSTSIPLGANFYDAGTGWVEHYVYWGTPWEVGYNMIRLVAQTNVH
jgi:hypothetical protein